jgi:hypothetical protein
MMRICIAVLIVVTVFQSGCESEKISQHVAEMSVDFNWQGLKPCGWGNPEIHISGLPENTKFLKINMYDHAYSHDHGTVQMPYAGEKVIEKDRFNVIQRPCPMYTPGRYEITIKALDDRETVIGVGITERYFPEE